MTFIMVKRGARPSSNHVYISEKSKTISFSVGFVRAYGMRQDKTKFLRLAFDQNTKEIAFDFPEIDKNDEYLKLTFSKDKPSPTSSINPILSTFSIDIKEISGTYTDKAISGPVKINGFSDNGFILKVKNREI